jgi:arginyl-tRNA synthetase
LIDVQALMARLKAKRFRQIFNYLDQDQAGVIDLLDLATSKMLFNITSLSSMSCVGVSVINITGASVINITSVSVMSCPGASVTW